MAYLLDTSVYSQPLKKAPIETALRRWESIGDHQCVISSVCQAEIEWGLHYADHESLWEKYRLLLSDRLKVLEVTEATWNHFSKMKARQRKIGQIISDLDLLIAASAAEHGLIVATLNRKDFERIEGISWEDWGL